MSVTRDEVVRMARLARLELDDAEVEGLREDLSGILEHMEALEEVSAEAVEEAGVAHRDGAAPLRDRRDEEPDSLIRPPSDNAPSWKDGLFTVPRLPAVEGREDETEARAP